MTQQNSPDSTAEVRAAWQALSRQALLPVVQERLAESSGVSLPRTARLALSELAERGDLRISELATFAGVDISTMSRSLRHLDAAGFISRQAGSDLRSVVVSITPAGERAYAKNLEAARQLLSDVLSAWSEEDRELLAGMMSRFAKDFGNYLAPAHRRAPMEALHV